MQKIVPWCKAFSRHASSSVAETAAYFRKSDLNNLGFKAYGLGFQGLEFKRLSLGTGWRRLIGCLKLQVNFRKRATNYRALLQKMTHEDKASYDSTSPCISETKF